jgi:50S ribosomal subunit-associated GTPase HflX
VLRRARSCLNVVLVGCAGAGKSTLFRALTGGPILPPSHPGVADARGQSGTRTRRLRVAGSPGAPAGAVVLTDTPGLTYDIERDVWTAPPETVEEATEADLLLHVVDGARPDAPQRRMAVERALRGIGSGLPARMLVVETQRDRTPGASSVTDESGFPSSVTDECCLPSIAGSAGRRVSGITGVGCRALAERLIEIAAQADARPVARDIGAVGGEGDCLLG